MLKQARYTFKSAAINPQLVGSVGGALAGGLGGYMASDPEDSAAGKALYTLGGAALGGSMGYAISHVPNARTQGGPVGAHAPAAHAPAAPAAHAPAAPPPAPAAPAAHAPAAPTVITRGPGNRPAMEVPPHQNIPPSRPPTQVVRPQGDRSAMPPPAPATRNFNNYDEFLAHEHPEGGVNKALMQRMQGLEQAGALRGGSLKDYKDAQNLVANLGGFSPEQLMAERSGLDPRGQQIVDYLLSGQRKAGAFSNPLLGALGGAGVGGLTAYHTSDDDNRLASTLAGAGLGGALGFGVGHGIDGIIVKHDIQNMSNKLRQDIADQSIQNRDAYKRMAEQELKVNEELNNLVSQINNRLQK